MEPQSEQTTVSNQHSTLQQRDRIFFFAVRAIIVGVVFVGAVSYLMPDLDEIKTSWKKEANREETRIRLKGLTTNPQVHWRVSDVEEERGNLRNAIEEIELAIGLFELHQSDPRAKQRYVERLNALRGKLAAATSK